jgi:glycosyltransferase A (GT-A) superfamily protein (DUF2064 family)
MWQAFQWVWRRSSGPTIIIGTDCLSFRRQDICEAFHKLTDHDCVIGPSRDGGYYLLGLNRPQKNLFVGIEWGSEQVLRQTLRKIHRLGWRAHLLKKREDIDTLTSLIQFLRTTPRRFIPRETRIAMTNITMLASYLNSKGNMVD